MAQPNLKPQAAEENKARKPTIYTGTFIHTLPSPTYSTTISDPPDQSTASIATLSVLEKAAVFVDEKGLISRIATLPDSSFTTSQGDESVDGDVESESDAWREGLSDLLGKDGLVGWDIVSMEGERPVGEEQRRRNKRRGGMWWFPGFVDTHIHASQHPNAGIFGTSTLLDWLNTYTFPLESSLSSAKVARRVYNACVKRTLSHGTTTAAYYATVHAESTNILADICLEKGQRTFVGRVCMDSEMNAPYYRDVSAEQAIKDTKSTIAHIRSIDPEHSLVCPIITPRFAPSCTTTLLHGLGELASSSDTKPLPIQTHISENPSECALVKTLFPEQADYASVYDAHGLLTPRTVLAHAIHLSASERALVKSRGAGVSHCPVSNTSLSSGLCPVRTLLDEGVGVGLGTDVSGGCSSSVLVAAREAAMVSRILAGVEREKEDLSTSPIGSDSNRKKLKVEECLYLATMGGAKIMGLGDKVGSFEVGKEWDAQLVEVEMVDEDEDEDNSHDDFGKGDSGLVEVWGKKSWSEKVAKWVFCGDDRNTKKVYVKGRLVHER